MNVENAVPLLLKEERREQPPRFPRSLRWQRLRPLMPEPRFCVS